MAYVLRTTECQAGCPRLYIPESPTHPTTTDHSKARRFPTPDAAMDWLKLCGIERGWEAVPTLDHLEEEISSFLR